MDESTPRTEQLDRGKTDEEQPARVLPYDAEQKERGGEGPSGGNVRPRPSACLIVAATFAVLAVSCLVLSAATLRGGLDGLGRLTGLVPSVNFGLVTTPTVTIDSSRPAVIEQVRALSKLETVHYQLEKVVTGKFTMGLPRSILFNPM